MQLSGRNQIHFWPPRPSAAIIARRRRAELLNRCFDPSASSILILCVPFVFNCYGPNCGRILDRIMTVEISGAFAGC